MTSEMEDLKTNEFLRRRKLRLQQVREQSKDIAKQIRQRTKVEKLRQVVDLDADKQKEYFLQQEKLVQRLQQLYAKGIENIGASHRGVSGANKQDELVERVDLSKIRGKEAAAELKRQKQEKLDKQKKSLDRKLHAREAANEISREKTSSIANKLTKPAGSKSIENKASNVPDDTTAKETDNHIYEVTNNNTDTAVKTDMATQWDFEGIPNEWEPHIPALSLPKDDRECYKDLANNTEIKLDKGKRVDLFALSDEMPSSLRGGLTNISEERAATKPSLTIVSEYLQSRAMRLREPTTGSSKKINEDLNSLKQTIIRTRSSKTEGLLNVCHVLDEQLIPMPSWQAETCGFCSLSLSPQKPVVFNSRQFKNTTSSQINKIFRSIRPVPGDVPPSPVLRETSPFRRNKVCPKFCSSKANYDKSAKSSTCDSGLNKKNLVTMYNHVTRDIRDIPYNDERLVVRDIQTEEDAYSQAMKESSIDDVDKDKVHQKKLQDMRNKVAMTKQSVEKEYKDTISFLNSLSKDKDNKPVKSAYMDEHRQQTQKENRQQKLQQEYRKIEKQCRKHSCVSSKNIRSNSKSPAKQNNEFDKQDFQYSWMPVPESDGNLAIHTIPTTLKESKSGNNVKFSKVDSYHEYRSRHKHTPPTKDTGLDRGYKRNVEATIVETSSESDLHTSSDTSSVGSLRIKTKRAQNNNTKKESAKKLSDAERIIIYKILDSKNDKIDKETREKLVNDIARSLRSIDRLQKNNEHDDSEQNKKHSSKEISKDSRVSFEQLNEGVYKTANDKGDNINAMYFEDNTPRDFGSMVQKNEERHPCYCKTKHNEHKDENVNGATHIGEASANPPIRIHSMEHKKSRYCGDTSKLEREPASVIPSAATSTTSLKVATNDKASNALPDGGYVKLIDDGGQEAGKFYIGATGFLRDDAYEVIIQLRKKETGNVEERKQGDKENVEETKNRSQHSAKCDDDVVQPGTDTINIQKATKVVHEAIPTQTKKNDQKDLSIQNNQSQEVIINKINKNQTSGEPIKDFDTGQEPINVKNVTDKGVGTSFQDYMKSDYVMKSDAIPRPATSIYTQTTLSSPRPVLIHMTSSTSTAYMSPPEMVLPRYLKHDYHVPSDDTIYDPTEKMQEADIRGHKYCKYKNCRCKWCHAKKCKRNKCSNTKFETPPNTARSSTSDRKHDVNQNSHKHYNPFIGCVKHNSHHCESCFKECFKSRRSKHSAASKSSSRKCIMRMSSNVASTYKNNSTPHDKRSGSYLNPVIKTYVNKLLALNRESLKAIEVADQECSSVATPSSSIINVPYNIDDRKADIQNKISFEQIKNMLKNHILEDLAKEQNNIKKTAPRINNARKKKPVHKVKSLNISKHLLKNTNTIESKEPVSNQPVHSSSSSSKKYNLLYISKTKSRSRSSPTPRREPNMQAVRKNTLSDIAANVLAMQETNDKKYVVNDPIGNIKPSLDPRESLCLPLHRSTVESTSVESVSAGNSQKSREISAEIPMNTSTQTNRNIDAELNFMQVAEDKLQNMEKIADLTEKCTKRLSNLAKVLEEVRKNKSLAYSQISTSDTSDSDQKSDKNVEPNINPEKFYEPIINIQENVKLTSPESIITTENSNDDLKYIPFLTDIPKPVEFKLPIDRIQYNKNNEKPNGNSVNENTSSKSRTKPPPALSRVSLKHGQEHVVPHELSTVMEVESPMSIIMKNLSSRNNINDDEPDNGNGRENEVYNISGVQEIQLSPKSKVSHSDPDLLQNNVNVTKQQAKISCMESSDDSKLQMMDLKQFNDIMLKPFITLKEYAKQCDVVGADEGSNLEDILRDGAVNDDISSLHSDGSLPDVIAELLKRNIISEPFKFDSASNINSTTISSESTLSLLALSKVRKDKKKSNVLFKNKENVAETSDTMSISSNPDLENAFKKLGLGWASSTLKKTKERLALSSSSNTSSSSLSQFKLRSYNNSDVPALVTDSVSSVINLSMKREAACKANDTSRNAEQQTSLTNSMTVKEFLNNELAKKITFTNKSNRNDTREEFVSLYETKMPEEMRHSSQIIREERSIDDSAPSGSNNRARTSTPVQIFKSMTYQSSSSSNMSNGLFSNADDLSSVKVTSNSNKNHSTSDKDDLTIPNFSLKMKKKSDCSMSE